jgi:hypothetical protein
LLAAADAAGKGALYNKAYNYVLVSRQTIEEAGGEVEMPLIEIQLQIYYRWKIARGMLTAAVGAVDWLLVKELSEEAMSRSTLAGNVLSRFLHALALAHLDDWAGSQLEFTQMRHADVSNAILWRPRALLMNSGGGPRSVQGVMRDAAGRKMLYVEELQADILCDKRGRWPRENEVAHANVQFSFGGSLAVDSIGGS